jgi:DNA-binding transcriptional ArsR family regulator
MENVKEDRVVMQTSSKLQGIDRKEAQRRLMLYGTLQNPLRLDAFLLISENPGIAFNEIAKRFKEDKALVAYHLGVLKTAGLVSFTYDRKGKTSYSSYALTDAGKRILTELAAAAAK